MRAKEDPNEDPNEDPRNTPPQYQPSYGFSNGYNRYQTLNYELPDMGYQTPAHSYFAPKPTNKYNTNSYPGLVAPYETIEDSYKSPSHIYNAPLTTYEPPKGMHSIGLSLKQGELQSPPVPRSFSSSKDYFLDDIVDIHNAPSNENKNHEASTIDYDFLEGELCDYHADTHSDRTLSDNQIYNNFKAPSSDYQEGIYSETPLHSYKRASSSYDQLPFYSDFTSSVYPGDNYLKASPSDYQEGVYSKIPIPGYQKGASHHSASYSDFASSGYGADTYLTASPSGYETGVNSEIPLPGYADLSGFFSKIPLKGYKQASPSTDQSVSYSDSTSSTSFGYLADKYLKTSLSEYQAGVNSEIPLPGYADASGSFSKIPLKGYKQASPSTDQSASYSDSTSSGYEADKYLKTSLSEYQAGVNSEISPPGYADAPPSND